MAAITGPPASVGHAAGRTHGVGLGADWPDGSVEQVLAALDDGRLGAWRRKVGRLYPRERVVQSRVVT